MRSTAIFAGVVVALALALDAGELMAKAQTPVVVTGMTSRPDLAQLQAAAYEWVRTTVTTSQFIIGLLLGITLGEVGRIAWRATIQLLGTANWAVGFMISHRLLVAAVGALVYYVTAFWVLA